MPNDQSSFHRIIYNIFNRIKIYYYFLFVFPPARLLNFTSPFLLSSRFSIFHFLPARGPPFENVTSPMPFSPMLYRLCTRAQKNCGKPMPIQSAIQQSLYPINSLWKNDFPMSMQAADRRSPIQVLKQRQAAWLGWPPGIGHRLPV